MKGLISIFAIHHEVGYNRDISFIKLFVAMNEIRNCNQFRFVELFCIQATTPCYEWSVANFTANVKKLMNQMLG